MAVVAAKENTFMPGEFTYNNMIILFSLPTSQLFDSKQLQMPIIKNDNIIPSIKNAIIRKYYTWLGTSFNLCI